MAFVAGGDRLVTVGSPSTPFSQDRLATAKIAGEYMSLTRMKLKRQILDELDKAHDFALPETLVASEFDGIWRQVTQGLEQAGKTLADEGKNEEEMRAELKAVNLGFLLNAPARVAMSKPGLRSADPAKKLPRLDQVPVVAKLESAPPIPSPLAASLWVRADPDFVAAAFAPRPGDREYESSAGSIQLSA